MNPHKKIQKIKYTFIIFSLKVYQIIETHASGKTNENPWDGEDIERQINN